jgi:Putative beta barrel porin-7 (BBP7)
MVSRLPFTLVAILAIGAPTLAETPSTPEGNRSQPTAVAGTGSHAEAAPEPDATSSTVPSVWGSECLFGSREGTPDTHYLWWTSVDALFAWTRPSSVPPLVTTSPAGTAQAAAGVLGQPNTSILFGNGDVDGQVRSGIRLGVGTWFDRQHTWGIDVGFSVLESQNTIFSEGSSGTPILARPFTNATNNTPSSQLVAFPGVASGTITASDGSGNFYDLHLDFFALPFDDAHILLEPLLGYRFLRYTDRLAVDSTLVSAGAGGVVAGTQIVTSDRFSAQNNFNGGDFGMRTKFVWNPWSLEVLGRLAVGNVQRSIGIAGATQTTVPGSTPAESAGGFLALSSNTGTFRSNDWVAIPEFGLNLSWNINNQLRIGLGYSFLYWSQIAHAADQVSLNLNPNLFPPATAGATPASPSFQLNKSEIWIQTLSAGLEYRF